MKKLLLTASLLFSVLLPYSQTFTPPAYAEIDTNYRAYVNNIFGILEPNRVNSGLLVVKEWKFLNNQKQYKLNVTGIRAGQYILVVTKGKYRQTT
ncbi:MAG: hypothetical protein IPK31_15555 [Chitinophagaceae bacterium]|nr:hypothetical protein [Chitinophagaceae bacterium]